jgi:hypothetical protein
MVAWTLRQLDHGPVDPLERVPQGRTVALGEDVAADLDAVVWPDPHDVRVEGTVVDRAHRDPVRHHRLTAFRIGADVRRLEELRVAEPTQRAPAPVRREHAQAEDRLVNPAKGAFLDVDASDR